MGEELAMIKRTTCESHFAVRCPRVFNLHILDSVFISYLSQALCIDTDLRYEHYFNL